MLATATARPTLRATVSFGPVLANAWPLWPAAGVLGVDELALPVELGAGVVGAGLSSVERSVWLILDSVRVGACGSGSLEKALTAARIKKNSKVNKTIMIIAEMILRFMELQSIKAYCTISIAVLKYCGVKIFTATYTP